VTKHLLEHDEFSGLTDFYHTASDGRFGVEIVQDVEPILENNKALQGLNDGYTPSKEFRRAASIPNVIIEKWRIEEGIDFFNPDHWPAIKRKLNDPDYLWLRTAPGRL
jgi:hypothetical protein